MAAMRSPGATDWAPTPCPAWSPGRQSWAPMCPPPHEPEPDRPGGRLDPGRLERMPASELLPLVYEELRRLAESRLARLPPGQTLQPTALVHDAYLRLVGDRDPGWNGRGHFFGAAARAMRNILVDQARRKSALRHGGDRRRLILDERGVLDVPVDADTDEVLSLDHVLGRLEQEHPRQAQVVLLRYFAGLTNEQVADLLGVATTTVKRDWRFARAWLRREMGEGEDPGG